MALESQTQLYGSSNHIPFNNLLTMDLENASFLLCMLKKKKPEGFLLSTGKTRNKLYCPHETKLTPGLSVVV